MAVAPAPHSDFQSMSTSEFDGIPDIIGMSTPCNQGGSSLRVGVPKKDTPRCLITGVRWKNEATLQLCAEFLESVRINLAYVTGCDLTEGCRQPQRSSCGERPLDELATGLTGVKIHEWEALIVQTVLRIGRMYPQGSTRARPRIVYESALNYPTWRITGKPDGILEPYCFFFARHPPEGGLKATDGAWLLLIPALLSMID